MLRARCNVIVNTDADNQYQGKYINDLYLQLYNDSEIVIGVRNTDDIEDFSASIFYKLGSKL